MCKIGIVNDLETALQVAHSIERYINDVLLFLIWKKGKPYSHGRMITIDKGSQALRSNVCARFNFNGDGAFAFLNDEVLFK